MVRPILIGFTNKAIIIIISMIIVIVIVIVIFIIYHLISAKVTYNTSQETKDPDKLLLEKFA